MKTERFYLDNGLKVVARQSRAAPVVSMAIWVGVGAADEAPSERGVAHVHEHMLFKGTERRGVGEVATLVESCGGAVNAFTAFDQTVFYLTISSRFCEVGLDVLGDIVTNPLMDADALDSELEVIVEEIRRSASQPRTLASRRHFELAFAGHPYRLPVIGTEEEVRRIDREAVRSFFDRWYVAPNMTLIVVGDVEVDGLRSAVEAHFGGLPSRDAPSRTRAQRDKAAGVEVALHPVDEPEVFVRLGFRIPGVEAQDGPALDALALLLGSGEGSRLVHQVQYRRQLVNSVGATAFKGRGLGLLIIAADLQVEGEHPGPIEVISALASELERVRREPVGEEELERVKTLLLSREVYQRQSVEGQAMSVGAFETEMGSWEAEADYDRRIAGLTAEGLMRVARRYLRPNGASVVCYGGGPLVEGLSEADVKRALTEALPPLGQAAPRVVGLDGRGMARVELDGGARVVVQRVAGVGLVSVRAAFPGGVAAEPVDRLGMSNLLARLWTRGTSSHEGPALAQEMENLAGALHGFSGKSTLGLRMDVLSRNLGRAQELFAECLDTPSFDAEELERERGLVQEGIRARRQQLGGLGHAVLHRALFGDHPYGLQASGTMASTARVSREDLVAYYARQVRRGSMVLAVCGDVDPDLVVEWAAEHLGGSGGERGREEEVERAGDHPLEVSGQPAYMCTSLDRDRVWIALGFRASPIGDPSRYALEVLSAALSGQGGRLFVELRDRRSLAYGVHAYVQAGLSAGEFVMTLSTSPSKVTEAVECLLEQVDALRRRGVAEAELERARQYLIGHNDIALQRVGARATRFCLDELYGLGHDATWRYAARILDVSAEDVARAARETLDLSRAALAIVHPSDVEPPSFAHLGFCPPVEFAAPP